VVACSGYSSEKEKSKALKLEMDDYLEKPLKRSEVERIVKSYLLD
jgi:CheY-like chemotaxis protein